MKTFSASERYDLHKQQQQNVSVSRTLRDYAAWVYFVLFLLTKLNDENDPWVSATANNREKLLERLAEVALLKLS